MNLTRSLILTSAVMLSLILLGEVFLLEMKRGGVDRARDVRGAGGVAQGHTRRSLAWRLRIHLLVKMLITLLMISLVTLRPLPLVHLAGEGHQPLKAVAVLVLPTPCLVPWSPGSGRRWARDGRLVLQISRLMLQMSWWVLQDQARSWRLGIVVARWHLVRVTRDQACLVLQESLSCYLLLLLLVPLMPLVHLRQGDGGRGVQVGDGRGCV